MPVFVDADRRGPVRRGTAGQEHLISRPRERGQLVLSLRPVAEATYLPIFDIGQAIKGGLR